MSDHPSTPQQRYMDPPAARNTSRREQYQGHQQVQQTQQQQQTPQTNSSTSSTPVQKHRDSPRVAQQPTPAPPPAPAPAPLVAPVQDWTTISERDLNRLLEHFEKSPPKEVIDDLTKAMKLCPLDRPDNLVLRLGEVFTPARTKEALAARKAKEEAERKQAEQKAARDAALIAAGHIPKKRGRPPGKKRKLDDGTAVDSTGQPKGPQECTRCNNTFEENNDLTACKVYHKYSISSSDGVEQVDSEMNGYSTNSTYKWKCCGKQFKAKSKDIYGYTVVLTKEDDTVTEGCCYVGPHSTDPEPSMDAEAEVRYLLVIEMAKRC